MYLMYLSILRRDMEKMAGGAAEVRSDKSLTLLAFGI